MRMFGMRRGVKFAAFAIMAVAAVALFSLLVMSLWNWLVPVLFGGPTLHFAQALGLLALSRILFGGLRGGGVGQRRHWRARMQERWQQLSPEERERYRERFAGRCGTRGGAASPPPA